VYGLVAAIVKLVDGGLYLSMRSGEGVFARLAHGVGRFILRAAPWLMKALSVAGTAAMFLVGGGILVHGIPMLNRWVEHVAERAATLPGIGSMSGWLPAVVANAAVGIVAGALALAVVTVLRKAWPSKKPSAAGSL
jgi:predicted DNA repair protein MutK